MRSILETNVEPVTTQEVHFVPNWPPNIVQNFTAASDFFVLARQDLDKSRPELGIVHRRIAGHKTAEAGTIAHRGIHVVPEPSFVNLQNCVDFLVENPQRHPCVKRMGDIFQLIKRNAKRDSADGRSNILTGEEYELRRRTGL